MAECRTLLQASDNEGSGQMHYRHMPTHSVASFTHINRLRSVTIVFVNPP